MIFFIERNVAFATDHYDVTEWFYDTTTLHFGSHIFGNTTTASSPPAETWPVDGTVLFSECSGINKTSYTYSTTPDPDHSPYVFNSANIVIATAPSSDCCTITGSDFTVSKVNNSSAISPNGQINFTSSTVLMSDYEASIDGGSTYHALPITGLVGGSYTVLLRSISTPCSLAFTVILTDTYAGGGDDPAMPTLGIQILQSPDVFVPVFLPVIYQFAFTGNTFTIRSDGRTYIDAGSNADLKTLLSQLPYLRIVGSTNYNGNVRVTDVDNPTSPAKFYISPITFVSIEVVRFIPIDRQIFQVFGETAFNVFTKIADVAVAADVDGVFSMRVEGFLQSMFEALQPANGDDISLGRKFYVVPRDYDLSLGSDEENPICTGVFGTQLLAPYFDALVPLGPTPINFIDTNTGLGLPVIFSFLNADNQRVTNVISAIQNEIITSSETVYIQALPGNTYTLTWLSPVPVDFYFYPALPEWITIVEQTVTSITLKIEQFSSEGGDYSPLDYSGADYFMLEQLNAIMGCYTFYVYDGSPGSDDEPIFTLTNCVFPTQLLANICGADLYNIAWVNLEGGWNSHIFKGVKKHGRSIGNVSTFKKLHELRKSSVDEVYDYVEVGFSMKSRDELAFITTLRTSIQAFLYNDQTLTWDIPILIDKASFPVYQTPFRQGEQDGSFIFKFANEVLIQRQ